MRVIKPLQIAVFVCFVIVIAAAAITTSLVCFRAMPSNDYRGILIVFCAVLAFYTYSIVVYRLFIRFNPLLAGEIAKDSKQEFIYNVYILFYLLIFYSIMRSGFVPAPLMRIFYLSLGVKMGSNSYSQGIIHDPPFVAIGANCTIGQSALLIPHVIEGDRLAHYPIKLGDDVTIGAGAIVLADVVIEDHAIVATGAVVPKGTHILANEVWGGVPAKRLRIRDRRRFIGGQV